MRLFLTTLTLLSLGAPAAFAQYEPPAFPESNEASSTLGSEDVPLGYGSFAKDYSIELDADTVVSVTLTSDDFDTLLTLIGPDGQTVIENDDDGQSTNSRIFTPVSESGRYIIRVSSYGSYYDDQTGRNEGGEGSFDLNVEQFSLSPL